MEKLAGTGVSSGNSETGKSAANWKELRNFPLKLQNLCSKSIGKFILASFPFFSAESALLQIRRIRGMYFYWRRIIRFKKKSIDPRYLPLFSRLSQQCQYFHKNVQQNHCKHYFACLPRKSTSFYISLWWNHPNGREGTRYRKGTIWPRLKHVEDLTSDECQETSIQLY